MEDSLSHADSLLASLNLQRDQAQFCDCVIRQSSAQLFLAHRCVLAASSPLLASLLAFNGTLLELQAPCLSHSDAVLRLVLDYIYTGNLPPPAALQRHYGSLLSAAGYLRMDKLLRHLQAARADAEDGRHASTPTEDVCGEEHVATELYTGLCESATEQRDCAFSAQNRENRCGASTASRTPAKRRCGTIVNAQLLSEDVCSEQNAVQIYSGLSENCVECRDRESSSQTRDENLLDTRMSSCLACDGSSGGSDTLAAATDECGRCTSRAGEASQATVCLSDPSVHGGGDDNRSPASSSSSPLSRGAVPVICHSRRVSVVPQPAETATLPHLCPGSRSSSFSSSSSAGARGGSRNSNFSAPPQAGMSPKEGRHSNSACFKDIINGHVESKHGVGTQSWSSDEASLDASAMQDYHRGNNPFGVQREDFSREYGLLPPKCTDVEDHLVRCDETKHPSKEGLPLHEDYKTVPGTEDYKDSLGYIGVSVASAAVAPATGSCCSSPVTACERQSGDRLNLSTLRPEIDTTSYNLPMHSYGGIHLPNPCQEYVHRQTYNTLSYAHPPSKSEYISPPDCRPDPLHSHEWERTNNRSSSPWSGGCGGGVAEKQLFLLDVGTVPPLQLPTRYPEASSSSLKEEESSTTDFSSSSGEERGLSQPDGPLSSSPPNAPARAPPRVSPSHHHHHAYRCALCDRSFSQRGSLNRHTRSHLGVRPYPCPRCPMTFSRQYRVTEHMRVHQRSSCGPPEEEGLVRQKPPPAPPT